VNEVGRRVADARTFFAAAKDGAVDCAALRRIHTARELLDAATCAADVLDPDITEA